MSRTHQKTQWLVRTLMSTTLCLAYAIPGQAEPTDLPEEAEQTITVKEVPAAAVKKPPFNTDDVPDVVKNLEQHDVQIVGKFDAPGGLQAYAGIAQQQPLAIYLTPDGKHVIIGTMMDEDGSDVTQTGLAQATVGPWTTLTWEALSNSRWVADGKDTAPHIIYMFTDPNCPFCHKFWQQSRPWIDSGHVQIRHILVGMLTQTSPGKAAAILAADDPAQALHDHENAGKDKGIAPLDDIPTELDAILKRNAQLMEQLQVQGTPGIFYFDPEGKLQIQRGAPLDEHLEQILGPR